MADPILAGSVAELAEPGQVAADLGRVHVRVLTDLLRRDRVAAHLLGLGEHLEIPGKAGRHADRQAFLRQILPLASNGL
jgi:hypothetical protein